MRTLELTGAALDWSVAKAEGKTPKIQCTSFRDAFIYRVYLGWSYEHSSSGSIVEYRPSVDWVQGGPIIEREISKIERFSDSLWEATAFIKNAQDFVQSGPTPLIAAMRCYVEFKLGHEIEIPEELTP